MGDTISRKALYDTFMSIPSDSSLMYASVAAMYVNDAPDVDAVEVVRCKNCKYYDHGVCENIAYIMDGYYRDTFECKQPDDFCSKGASKMEALRTEEFENERA